MIKIALYNTTIKIVCFDTHEKLKKKMQFYIKKFDLLKDDDNQYYEGCVIINPLNTGEAFIFFVKECLTINTITHEVYHLTNRILDNHGITVSIDEDENHAILNGYLNEEILKYFIKKKWLIIPQ